MRCRQAQFTEVKTFVSDVERRITKLSDKVQRQGDDWFAVAVEAWHDFVQGYLCGQTKAAQANATRTLQALAYNMPPAGSGGGGHVATSPVSAGGSGGNSGGSRAISGNGGSQAGGVPTGRVGNASGGSKSKLAKMLSFSQQIPCSEDIVGPSLGIKNPTQCQICRQGFHYHGECPLRWARASRPLPGFGLDGLRDSTAWSSTGDPLRKTVRKWIAFLKDQSNFNGADASVSGHSGSPSLADFEAFEARAPKR